MSTNVNSAADPEVTLAFDDLRVKVAPYGASLRGMWRESAGGTPSVIVTCYTGAEEKKAGQGDVLIPFPGRVAAGRYTFEGESFTLEHNDGDGPNAIHGFLRHEMWEIRAQSAAEITFAVDLKSDAHTGYPFSLAATVDYALDAQGLTCRFTVTNTGDRDAPVAAGFHPYFTVGSDTIDADILHVPFKGFLEFEKLIPTGKILPVAGTPLDFRTPRAIGDVKINTCFMNPIRDADGLLRVRLASQDGARAVTVWMDSDVDYVVLYSGDPLPPTLSRRSLAIEPMTCASDALNHPEWGLAVLAPGQTRSGTWGILAS